MTDTKKMSWEKLREGVFIKHLARDEKRDFQIDIIKLKPSTTYPQHQHADVEWVYVLKGGFIDEFGSFEEGDFKINPKYSRHTITTGKFGAELLICWCGRLTGE